jgi:hypothetical protein
MLLAAAGTWYRLRAAVVILGSGAGRSGKGHQRRHSLPDCDEGLSEMRDATNPSRDGSEDYGQEADLYRPSDNLPLALTSFVGREREMTNIEKLLVESRLLTLTRPGGSGKTRLALAMASELAGRFEGGVWLVQLAPLSDPDLVPQGPRPSPPSWESARRPAPRSSRRWWTTWSPGTFSSFWITASI